MSRSEARERAFQVVFGFAFQDKEGLELLEAYQANFADINVASLKPSDKEYISKVVKGVRREQSKIDQRIDGALEDWTLDRLGKVDAAVLRVAVYEMFYMPSVPLSISIDEAVRLAKKYGTDESYSLVNGVLATLAKDAPEKPAPAKDKEDA